MNTDFLTRLSLVRRVVKNRHTSAAAVVYFGAKCGSKLGAIWLPSHAEQLNASGDLLEGLAVSYGLLMAGDSAATALDPVDKNSNTTDK